MVKIWKGKGNKFRITYIQKETRILLRKYLITRKDNSPCLWIGRGGERLKYAGLREIITRRSEEASIPTPGLHEFRRCFAITMHRNGVDNITLAKLMGHSSLEVLKRYLDIQDYDLKAAHAKGSPLIKLK